MAITGYISVGLPFGTNSENDPYFVTDPRYGLGGLRSVSGISDRNDIPLARRQVGMLVYVANENEYYTLVSGISNSDWIVFETGTGGSGGSDFYGLTGITSTDYPLGLSSTGITGDRLLVATGPPRDPFRQYIRFGNAWVQTGVVGMAPDAPKLTLIDTFQTSIEPIVLKQSTAYSLNGETINLTYAGGFVPATGCAFLTDPTKGTGFPIYFNSTQNNEIVFDSQTITAGIGESVTIRIVVTGAGSPPTSDSYDYEIRFENEMLWGLTALSSISTNPFDVLSNSRLIDGIDEEFAIGLSNDTYLYVAYPVRHGQANISINNAAFGGFGLQGYFGIPGGPTAQATNDGDFSEPYYVYRTEHMLGDRFIVKLAPTQ